jgi:hypothetical protein
LTRCGVLSCHLPEILNGCEGCPRLKGFRDLSEDEKRELIQRLCN